jgi:glutamate-ammonia-ligase adenylyltransferase
MQSGIPEHWIQPFLNPEKAKALILRIADQVTPAHLRFMDRLIDEVRRTVDRDRILTNMERLCASVIDKAVLFRTLSDFPPIIVRLVQIFHSSQYLSDILIRDPQYVSYCISPETYCRPLTPEDLHGDILKILDHPTFSQRRRLDALRILRRRYVLTIGLRDLILNEDMTAIVRDLSLVADAVVDGLVRMFSTPGLAVIALGKWGGQELNYSSDIDLMFVYDDEGSDGNRHEMYNRAAENIMMSLNEITREGRLYRADARLRPDGNSGPLARSVSSCLHYYESRGKVWERQMLIKARAAAGDVSCGQAFVDAMRPFVYPATFFRSPIDEIARMKWKIEEEKSASEWNVKIAPGGIRDIEFIVQALQLINGGRNPDVRTPTTLTAIDRLKGADLLSSDEAATLRTAYVWYRRIEHLVQIESDRQTHSVDENRLEQERLAQLLGFADAGTFLTRLERSQLSVRTIFDNVFVPDGESPFSKSLIQDQWDITVRTLLHQANVSPSPRVQQSLRHLAFGHFPKLYDNTTRGLLEQLLPSLMAALGRTASPEETLVRFERLVYAYPSAGSLYRLLLSNPRLMTSFVYLCSLGSHMSNVLVESPALIEFVLPRLGTWMNRPDEMIRDIPLPLQQFKSLEWIRLALLDADKIIGEDGVYLQLSRLADHCVRMVAADRLSASSPMLMAAMGKWGGADLSYRSDLDVVWICNDDADLTGCETEAKTIMQMLREITPYGRLYDIDARLRPEGDYSPLVVTAARFQNYFKTRAAFWEKQALIRWRPVAGSSALAEQLTAVIDGHRYRSLTESDLQAVLDIRRKQMSEKIRRPEDAVRDLKFSAGGLLDVEYAVQLAQMHLARHHPALRTTSIYPAFDALENIFPHSGFKRLRDAYHFLRQLEKFAFLSFERSSPKLPSDEKQIDILSHFCDISIETNLLAHVSERKKEVESLFNSILMEILHEK